MKIYQNGYPLNEYGFPENGLTYGTSATIELILTKKSGVWSNSEIYLFEYVWSPNYNYANWNDSKQISVTTKKGNNTTSAIIYLDSYTGEGMLCVRQVEKASPIKQVKINLDNSAPEGNVYVKDGSGNLNDINEYIDNTYFCLSERNEKDGRWFYKLYPNIVSEFIDENAGLAPAGGSFEYYYCFTEAPNYQPNYGADKFYNAGVSPYSNEIIKKYYVDNQIPINNSEFNKSGEYYLNTGLRHSTTNIIMIDSLGNNDKNIVVSGPIKIDFHEPNIDKIFFDDDGNAKIEISDDYSGLSDNFSSIKYAWVENKGDEPEKWESVTNDQIQYTEYTENYKDKTPLKLIADVGFPDLVGNWYLCVKLDGYKDVAGNIATTEPMYSDETVGYADINDLVITIEDGEVGYPVNEKVTIKSISGKPFVLNYVGYKHDGLDDLKSIPVDSNVRTEYTCYFETRVNGPITVYIEDSFGKTKNSDSHMMKNVQETQLYYAIPSGKKLVLPIEKNLANENLLLYVDWGDGTGNYITKYLYDMYEVENKSEDLWVYDVNIYGSSDGAPVHQYNSIGFTTIKITGEYPNPNKCTFAYGNMSILQESSSIIFKDENKAESFKNLIKDSRDRLLNIIQFGIHDYGSATKRF